MTAPRRAAAAVNAWTAVANPATVSVVIRAAGVRCGCQGGYFLRGRLKM